MRSQKYEKGEIARRGQELYETKIRALVEADNIGKFLEIDVESGDYEMDKSEIAASQRLRQRHPDGAFYLMRIGYRAAYSLGGGLRVTKIRSGGDIMQNTKVVPSEITRLGQELYELKIRALVEDGNKGKFLVMDVDSGDYEVDKSDVAAIKRLKARKPEGRRFMMRIGYVAAYSLGGGMIEA